ncbi:hypothetical protein D7Y21_20555 [Corallococcus sp. AB045]|uniref:hypothetical protein n=1 Tax=Corallococcus sp. AB045 TaxID=2316719 RepID=UPI000EE18063|nr:hypothetical protein [Corallococcus sp. AB045]RKH86692.1 hypothetical protein D7Y21_20555 [Corallococcus sp. AB045]
MARVDEKKPVVVPPPPPKSEAPQVEPKVKAAKDFQKVAQRRREDAAVGQQKAHQDATTAKKTADTSWRAAHDTAALWDGMPNAPEAGYGQPDPSAIKTGGLALATSLSGKGKGLSLGASSAINAYKQRAIADQRI